MVITARWLLGRSGVDRLPIATPTSAGVALRVLPASPDRGDLLRTPLLGRMLRSARFRLGLRLVALAVLIGIAVDGLLGPDESPMNLAGTLPWTHWRGVTVVLLAILLGNVACFACPLDRAAFSVLRRWISADRRQVGRSGSDPSGWPSASWSSWLVVVRGVRSLGRVRSPPPILLLGLVGASRPCVDLLFEGAAFCRYVCPVGQYQMADVDGLLPGRSSAIDPRSVRDLRHAATVWTARPRRTGLRTRPPAFRSKSGNLDCTFCLDCVTRLPA